MGNIRNNNKYASAAIKSRAMYYVNFYDPKFSRNSQYEILVY